MHLHTIKTHGCVSCGMAKKVTHNTNMLLMQMQILPISTYCNSYATKPISTKLTYIFYALHMYTIPCIPNLNEIVSAIICAPDNLSIFFVFCIKLKLNLGLMKLPFCALISFKLGIRIIVELAYISINFDKS